MLHLQLFGEIIVASNRQHVRTFGTRVLQQTIPWESIVLSLCRLAETEVSYK